jgi:hypothetical protein
MNVQAPRTSRHAHGLHRPAPLSPLTGHDRNPLKVSGPCPPCCRPSQDRVGGDFCGRPLSHHRTCFIASGGSPRNRRAAESRQPAPGIPSSSAEEGSALWPNPSSFTAFAQPVVAPSGAFCFRRLPHEPLKFLSSSTFGPSRCRHIGTMTSADSCRLNPTSRSGLLSADRVAAGLPR